MSDKSDCSRMQCLAARAQVAALTAENERLRVEVEAEEIANRMAARTVQDAYERECARLRSKLAALRADPMCLCHGCASIRAALATSEED